MTHQSTPNDENADRPSEDPPERSLLHRGPPPTVIVLAGGRGSRFVSNHQKVLHPLSGRTVLDYVLDVAAQVSETPPVVVTNFDGPAVAALVPGAKVEHRTEADLGQALEATVKSLAAEGPVVVLLGDEPFTDAAAVRQAMSTDGVGAVAAVHEGARRLIALATTGDALQRLTCAADLAGVIKAVLPAGATANVVTQPEPCPPFDSRADVAHAELLLRERTLQRLMAGGVTVIDPATTFVHATVQVEPDVTIEPQCHLYGETRIASGTVVGHGSTLRNAIVGRDCRIEASTIEDSHLSERVHLGPYAHLRAGAFIGDDCFLGNYAEVKNSRLGRNVKMHHFSFVGDADVGDYTNIAAGVITCNYDGVHKHRTTIGDQVFVGCDTMLIAPVTLGDGARTGAGAVVSRDVAPGTTVVGVPARPLKRDT